MVIYTGLMVIIGLIIVECTLRLIRDNKELNSTLTDKPDFSRYVNKTSHKD
jgi:hypothetical protein